MPTDYTKKIFSGQLPSQADLRNHILQSHSDNTAITELNMRVMKDQKGLN